ncbi:MAG: hypothetical protein PHV30_10075 [Candidatus Margulisbacteria bacterium]|nr:hypothetical protein [Candidatus Margulisiibacteriota bacterium]
MKTIRLFVVVIVLVIITFGMNTFAGEIRTIRGEVIDLSCYIKSGLLGEEHKQCIASGEPTGILELFTGNIFVVVDDDKKKGNPGLQLIPYITKIVDVTGEVNFKGGTRVITIKDIKEIKPSPTDNTVSPAQKMETYGY